MRAKSPLLSALPALVAGCVLSLPPSDLRAGSPGDEPMAQQGETRGGCNEASADGECLELLLNHLRQVKFDRSVKTVLVGNPAIADANMLNASNAVISARSVGATNMLFLDADGRLLGDYEVFVREPSARRVVLHRGPTHATHFQCAPRCERTLSPSDHVDEHNTLKQRIESEMGITRNAVGDTGKNTEADLMMNAPDTM
ncbi:MAG: pilus assembly protein N-terminal domain-containing protein [Neomegalonema sp.]|nr:pilus assembly protein N-terminal domain-containing protein [Neomegalonema sp.]